MGYIWGVIIISNIVIRRCWDEHEEEWRYSVIDVIRYITRSKDTIRYFYNLGKRKTKYEKEWGNYLLKVQIQTEKGKFMITTSNLAGLWWILKAIPRKYEGRKRIFKSWVE